MNETEHDGRKAQGNDDGDLDGGPAHGHRAGRWRGLRFGIVAAALLGIGALTGALGAAAFSAHAFGGFRHGGEHMVEHVKDRVDWALERVEATPEQRQQIAIIVDDTAAQLLPMRDTHRGLRQDFVDAMLAGSIDAERMEALRQQHLVQHDEASAVVVGAISEVASVLTPEQRQELYDMRGYRLR